MRRKETRDHLFAGGDGDQLWHPERDGNLGGDVLCAEPRGVGCLGLASAVPRKRSRNDLRYLAAYEPERKPGVRTGQRGWQSAGKNTARKMGLGAMFTSKSFWLATGLRFGQAGNSGLIQTFLAGYLVQTLLFEKRIPTDALMISSVIGFLTIPFLGWLSDKIGRRIPYIIMCISAIILAYPMLSIIVDKSYSPGIIMLSIIVIHNCAVLGLFALENITMAEMFGSRTALPVWRFLKKRVVWWRLVLVLSSPVSSAT
jgi:hypothetical protein